MGSNSDMPLMKPAAEILEDLGIEFEIRVMSAHRTPGRTVEFVSGAREQGIRVFICAAGGAAHLAGVVAGHTTLPVIGVPLARTPLAGADALYATVQMPKGMPVATVAIDGSANAAILAAQILAVGDPDVLARVEAMREATRQRVIAADLELQKSREASS
jgi:5-(carboxyamino)imidazole ribonucleotide mutase